MAVQKRSISFNADVLAEAERLSQERGGNLSKLVNEALEHELRIAGGRKLMEEDEKRWGPIPEDVIAEVDRLWQD